MTSLKERKKMTREEIITTFTDLGLEAPNKGVINNLLNAFNKEKAQEIEVAKKTATDEAEAKYKDFVKPEDYQKILADFEAEKGKGALAERKAKYDKAGLNIEDQDIFNLLESKFKDSTDFDKEIEAYAKEHPFVCKPKQKKEEEAPKPQVKEQETRILKVGGGESKTDNGEFKADLSSAISSYYTKE